MKNTLTTMIAALTLAGVAFGQAPNDAPDRWEPGTAAYSLVAVRIREFRTDLGQAFMPGVRVAAVRLNFEPPRLNSCPRRGDIELKMFAVSAVSAVCAVSPSRRY